VDIGDDLYTFPAKVKRLGKHSFGITIKEGRNRQIRRMVDAVGNKVKKLKRIRVDKYELGNLPEGKWEYMSNV
ncbi:MAG: rRNA pseudouridine synthase, partial [Candidatus Margulisbacteria bacterium]|nr:rRNA pseudouridine synthase [Candidatus Margulisiibacteriota bacterium]